MNRISVSGDQKTKVSVVWPWMRGISASNIKETGTLPFIPAEAVDLFLKGIVERQERQGNRFFSTDILNGDGSFKKDEQGRAMNTSDSIYLSFLKECCPYLFSRYNNDIVTREFLNQGQVKSSVLERLVSSNRGSHFSEQFKIAKKEHIPTFWLRQNDHLRISKRAMADITKFLTEGYAAFKKEKDGELASLERVNWEAPPSTGIPGILTQLIPSNLRIALNLPSNFPLSNNELLKVCNLDLAMAESIAIIFHNEAGGNNSSLGLDDTTDAITQTLRRGSIGLTQIYPNMLAKLVPGILDTVERKADSLYDPTKASRVREMVIAIRDAHVAYDAASKKFEYRKKNKPGDTFGIVWGEREVGHLREEYKNRIIAALKDPVTHTLFAVALAQDNNKSVVANLNYYNFRSPNIPGHLEQNLRLFGISTAHNVGPSAARTLMEANISLLAAKQMGIEVSPAEVSNIRYQRGYTQERAAAGDVRSLAMRRILERMEQWQQNLTMVSGSEKSLYDAIKAGGPDAWIQIKNARSEIDGIGSSSVMKLKSTNPPVFKYPNLVQVFLLVTQHLVDPTKLTDPVILNSPEFFGRYFIKGATTRRANLFPAIDRRNKDAAKQILKSHKEAETQASKNREMAVIEVNLKGRGSFRTTELRRQE